MGETHQYSPDNWFPGREAIDLYLSVRFDPVVR